MPPFPTSCIAVRPPVNPRHLVVLVGMPFMRRLVTGVAMELTAPASACNQNVCQRVRAAADMVDVPSLTRFLDATEQQIQVRRPATCGDCSTQAVGQMCLRLHRDVSRPAPN